MDGWMDGWMDGCMGVNTDLWDCLAQAKMYLLGRHNGQVGVLEVCGSNPSWDEKKLHNLQFIFFLILVRKARRLLTLNLLHTAANIHNFQPIGMSQILGQTCY